MLPSPAPDRSVVFLIRHGATEANLSQPPMLQGRGIDQPLAARGEWQAQQVARLLSGFPLDAVYGSPLARAQQTAAAIAQHHRLAVQTVNELIEVDAGDWEGSHWAAIAREHPDAYRRFLANPAEHGYLNGENLQQVHDRVTPVLERLAAENLGRRIAIVAHNVVIRSYLAGRIGIPLAQASRLKQENCAVNVLTHEGGQTVVHTINSTFHLLAG